MKLGCVVAAQDALRKLACADLTVPTLCAACRLLARAEQELERFERAREEIVRSLGRETDGRWTLPPENRAEYERRLAETLDLELESDLPALSIPPGESVRLSYADLKALEGMVSLGDVQGLCP